MDKTATNAYYEVEVNPETYLPTRIRITVLTGKRGETEKKGRKIIGGEHVAFHFDYKLTKFNEVEFPKMPKGARKSMR